MVGTALGCFFGLVLSLGHFFLTCLEYFGEGSAECNDGDELKGEPHVLDAAPAEFLICLREVFFRFPSRLLKKSIAGYPVPVSLCLGVPPTR